MKQWFINWKPSRKSQYLLDRIEEIIIDYQSKGYRLTLRQLYYQMVSRDYVPNSLKSYNTIGNLINNARLAGIIDWSVIEDRVRTAEVNSHWNNPNQILSAAVNSYYKDHWKNQENYIEVWCEKDAVSNIIQPVCSKYDVLFMANRGYSSQSAMYEAYQRLQKAINNEKYAVIIYFGDHDPSGIDMTRDIEDRMGLFLYGKGKFKQVDRQALNKDQIKRYNPPRNPAKITDTRFNKYSLIYGESSWELDALDPGILSDIVENAILKYMNKSVFDEVEKEISEHKNLIRKAITYLNQ